MFYAAMVAAGAIGALGDGLLTHWAQEGGAWWWVAGGFVCWNAAGTTFLVMLRRGSLLAHSAAVFAAANSLLILYLAWSLFQEPLSTTGWIGVGFVAAGLVIAELGSGTAHRPHDYTARLPRCQDAPLRRLPMHASDSVISFRHGAYLAREIPSGATRELTAAQRLRHRVFVEDRGWVRPSDRNVRLDVDAYDVSAHHFTVTDSSGQTVGTIRLLRGGEASFMLHKEFAALLDGDGKPNSLRTARKNARKRHGCGTATKRPADATDNGVALLGNAPSGGRLQRLLPLTCARAGGCGTHQEAVGVALTGDAEPRPHQQHGEPRSEQHFQRHPQPRQRPNGSTHG
jgi:multidrug transporter EmrE-like cation transporter